MLTKITIVLRGMAQRVGIRTSHQFRLALRAVLIVITVLSGFGIGVLTQLQMFWWAVLPLVVLLVATLLEFVLADYITAQSYPLETERMLRLLEDRLGNKTVQTLKDKMERIILDFKACDREQISGTVHVTVELAPSAESQVRRGLLQLTDYVGPRGGSKGRITILEKGVIGRCARTGKTEFVNFSDLDEYRRRMVEEFGFSKDETERHTTFARSYIAEPLIANEAIVGVLYFFSSEPQVFPAAAMGLSSKAQDCADLLKTVGMFYGNA